MKSLKKTFLFLLLFISWLANIACAVPTVVTVSGKQLLVDGKPFAIKGVNYSPVPVGYDYNYNWGGNPAIYNSDLPLLKAMGVNTVRTYQEHNISQGFLDACQQNGIYVIVGWFSDLWDKDFSSTSTRKGYVDSFQTFVTAWKDHPAVLMWCFGNEIEEHTLSPKADWYKLLGEASVMLHGTDSNHPITTANQEVSEIGDNTLFADDASLPSLDIWGVNIYHGKSFGAAFFSSLAGKTAKPFLFTEWGCDAYDGKNQKEDQSTQDSYIRSLWSEISANLSSQNSSNSCLGGLVFEWCDEWWKSFSNSMGNSGHDTATDWINGGYSDPNMNEEWWGIASVSPGTYERTLRVAYFSLRDLWAPGALTAFTGDGGAIFEGSVRNFPNPLVSGAGFTRIQFAVKEDPEFEISIFDLSGNKICDLQDIYKFSSGIRRVDWYGKDSAGSYVPTGLYVCKVKAKTGTNEEVRYRKIAVVK